MVVEVVRDVKRVRVIRFYSLSQRVGLALGPVFIVDRDVSLNRWSHDGERQRDEGEDVAPEIQMSARHLKSTVSFYNLFW